MAWYGSNGQYCYHNYGISFLILQIVHSFEGHDMQYGMLHNIPRDEYIMSPRSSVVFNLRQKTKRNVLGPH